MKAAQDQKEASTMPVEKSDVAGHTSPTKQPTPQTERKTTPSMSDLLKHRAREAAAVKEEEGCQRAAREMEQRITLMREEARLRKEEEDAKLQREVARAQLEDAKFQRESGA